MGYAKCMRMANCRVEEKNDAIRKWPREKDFSLSIFTWQYSVKIEAKRTNCLIAINCKSVNYGVHGRRDHHNAWTTVSAEEEE